MLPKLHRHLEDNGFELNYFVMKWVMGLFSEDMPKPMLLAVWDVLCQAGLDFLPSLIISVLSHLENELLES